MRGGRGQAGRGLGTGCALPRGVRHAAPPVPRVLASCEALLSCMPGVCIGVCHVLDGRDHGPVIELSLQLLSSLRGLAAVSPTLYSCRCGEQPPP